MAHLLRASRVALQVSRRSLFTTPACRTAVVDISEEDQIKFYPKIGFREIVGFGDNGEPIYADLVGMPCPGVRFQVKSADLIAKEKGDWKTLTMDEKKQLYRATFCQTFVEMEAPTGDWKNIFAMVLLAISVSGWFLLFINRFVYPPKPGTFTVEWQEKQIEQMVRQGQGPISGVASKWDYENNRWK